jgi:hypothetical protein
LAAIGLLAASSCSSSDSSGGGEVGGSGDVGTTVEDSGDGADVGGADVGGAVDGEVVFVDGSIEPSAVGVGPLGDLSFSADSASVVTATYEPGAAPFVLELVASDGHVWTLEIPSLALGRSTDISMTALTDLGAGEIPGRIVSGVQLGPDGLQFDVAATLTVSGGAPDGVMVLVGGAHDGTGMDFAMPANGSMASAQVTHFSSYGADDLDEAALLTLAEARYRELQASAREVLADRQLEVPVPPALPLQCVSGDEAAANEAAMSAFREAFADPEIVLVQQMLAVGTDLQLLGSQTEVFTTEKELVARSVSKARALFLEYGGDVGYLPAVGAVLLNALRNAQLLGTADPEIDADFAELAAMYRRQIQGLLDELIEQHEYRNVQAILDMERWAALLVGAKGGPEELLASIEGAMRFELQLSYTLVIGGNQTYVFESTIPVRWETGDGRTNHLMGTGTGSLTSYTDIPAPEVIVRVAPFPVIADLSEFSPCDGTAKLRISPLVPESETVIIDEELSADMPLTMNSWTEMFGEFEDGDAYLFPLELRNGDATAVEMPVERTAPGSQGQVVGALGIRLVHQPERT